MKQKFFTVEGLDGSGKTIMTQYLADFLRINRVEATCVESYPRDEDSMVMRDLWIHQKVPPVAVLSCILELRKRVLVNKIIPALLNGHVVISDRWNDTTWVYQHYAVGISRDTMEAVYREQLNLNTILHEHVGDSDAAVWLKGQLTNYETIHLDVSLETSRARVAKRNVNVDAFEKAGDEFFRKLSHGYFEHYVMRKAQRRAESVHMVDANRSVDVIKEELGRLAFSRMIR